MCLNIKSFVVSETWSFENFSSKENFSDDISRVNLMVAWNRLAKPTKLLISFSGKVHTEKLSSVDLFQKIGFCGLAASTCFSMGVMNMTATESYCHFATHSAAVCLQEMFVNKLKRVFFKDQWHEFSQVCCWNRLF